MLMPPSWCGRETDMRTASPPCSHLHEGGYVLNDQLKEHSKVLAPGLAVRRSGVVESGSPLRCILRQTQLLQQHIP